MTIIQSFLLEAVATYGVDLQILTRLIESASKQFAQAKKRRMREKIDFSRIIAHACENEFLEDIFICMLYKQAVGYYFQKKRRVGNQKTKTWEVTRTGSGKIRVKIADNTKIEFRILESRTWKKGCTKTHTTFDSPCFIHGEGPREVDVYDEDLIKLAEQCAYAWLKDK